MALLSGPAEAVLGSAAASSSPPATAAIAGAPVWTTEQVRQALNDRYLIARKMEKTGLRRILMACGCFIGAFNIRAFCRGLSLQAFSRTRLTLSTRPFPQPTSSSR
jgi:hypothetical protein